MSEYHRGRASGIGHALNVLAGVGQGDLQQATEQLRSALADAGEWFVAHPVASACRCPDPVWSLSIGVHVPVGHWYCTRCLAPREH